MDMELLLYVLIQWQAPTWLCANVFHVFGEKWVQKCKPGLTLADIATYKVTFFADAL